MILLFVACLVGAPTHSRSAQSEPPHAAPAAGDAGLLGRGIGEYRAGNFQAATRDLESAIRAKPHEAEAHAYLGLAMARMGDHSHAAEELERAHEIDPANPDFAYDYSLLLIDLKRYSAAIPILEKLRSVQQSPEVTVNLARAYAGSGKWNSMSALVASLPGGLSANENFLQALAGILASSKQFGALENLWQRAIRRDPGASLPYAALAELWIEENRPREAIAMLDRAPQSARDPVFLYAYGEAQMALQDSAAVGTFRRLVEQTPGNQSAWVALIRAELMLGKFGDAEVTAQQAGRQFPDSRVFLYEVAVADYLMDRNDAALAAVRQVIGSPGGSIPQDLLLAAVLESETGNYVEAVNYFHKLESAEPTCDALAAYFFGATLLRMHQPSQAVAKLRIAIACRPRFALAEYRLGQGLAELGRINQAVAMLGQATHDDPNLSDAYYVLAQLRRRTGDTQGARLALEKFNQVRHDASPDETSLFRNALQQR
ncbi:MAG TPA: tetratricopeptide repeat protein [Terriglobia bacterium]|nr:tetratricopeptide repeat protein [Terriglobia bacterium]